MPKSLTLQLELNTESLQKSFSDAMEEIKQKTAHLQTQMQEMATSPPISLQVPSQPPELSKEQAVVKPPVQKPKIVPELNEKPFRKRLSETLQNSRKEFSDFFTKIKSANTFGEVTQAVSALGARGASSLLKLVGPWGAVAAGAAAAFAITVRLTNQFSQLEDAARKASNAFRMGGRMEGVGLTGFQKQAREMSADGSLDYQDVIQGMGSLRKSGFSLDRKTFEEVTQVAKDGASFLGGNYSQTLEKLGGILHSTEVSYDELVSAGLTFTAAEYRQIDALKGVYNQTERNRIILAKMQETYEGAAAEQSQTVSGMMGAFGTHFKGIMEDIGAILAPIVKLVMGIVNPIMQIVRALLVPFVGLGKILGKIVDGLNRIINAILDPIMGAFQRLSESILELFGSISDTPWLEIFISVLEDIGKMIGGLISLVVDGATLIIRCLMPILRFLNSIGEVILDIGQKIKTYIVDGITDLFSEIAEFVQWASEKFGLEMDLPQEDKDSEYVDPRMKMNVNFEDGTSMSRRIQQSLLERNSPAVKQVDLLTMLNHKVEVLVVQNEKANSHRQEQKDLTQKELKAFQEYSPGLA